jgi:hypothetical protein
LLPFPPPVTVQMKRRSVAQDAIDVRGQRVERLREDELLRQRDVRQVIGAEQQAL